VNDSAVSSARGLTLKRLARTSIYALLAGIILLLTVLNLLLLLIIIPAILLIGAYWVWPAAASLIRRRPIIFVVVLLTIVFAGLLLLPGQVLHHAAFPSVELQSRYTVVMRYSEEAKAWSLNEELLVDLSRPLIAQDTQAVNWPPSQLRQKLVQELEASDWEIAEGEPTPPNQLLFRTNEQIPADYPRWPAHSTDQYHMTPPITGTFRLRPQPASKLTLITEKYMISKTYPESKTSDRLKGEEERVIDLSTAYESSDRGLIRIEVLASPLRRPSAVKVAGFSTTPMCYMLVAALVGFLVKPLATELQDRRLQPFYGSVLDHFFRRNKPGPSEKQTEHTEKQWSDELQSRDAERR
jgi:hypothetical protein